MKLIFLHSTSFVMHIGGVETIVAYFFLRGGQGRSQTFSLGVLPLSPFPSPPLPFPPFPPFPSPPSSNSARGLGSAVISSSGVRAELMAAFCGYFEARKCF